MFSKLIYQYPWILAWAWICTLLCVPAYGFSMMERTVFLAILPPVLITVSALTVGFIAWVGATRNSYITVITKSRIEWIEKLRTEFAELLPLLDVDSISEEGKNRVRGLLISILLRLNPNDELDKEIQMKIEDIQNDLHAESFEFSGRDGLVVQMQSLLKREWDKAKREAKHPLVVMDLSYEKTKNR